MIDKKEMPLIIQENPGLWDPNKTINQNAAAHKISYTWARNLASRYNLGYVKEKVEIISKPLNWNESSTLETNAKILKIHRSTARRISIKFNLKFLIIPKIKWSRDSSVPQNSKHSSNLQKFVGDQESVLI